MTVIDSALIHQARMLGSSRGGTRNAQGEYARSDVVGPWIPARVMVRGSVAAEARSQGPSSEGEVTRGYEILLSPVDVSGTPITPPTASTVLETACTVLGSPTIKLNGEPEALNNGQDLIGFLCFGDVPLDRS